ncbi:MAG TPA: carboxyl transferase domain-containing protein, partial [Rhodopila sp.]|nr:carboxyl transferase domain-containing protein [Rhodopila sp.]
GLGRFTPEEVGPVTVQAPNGVIDVLVADEAEAVRVARQYLSYFQGRVPYWEATDPIGLRHLVPENRRRVYDTKRALELIADRDSILELRPTFGVGLATVLIRIEGRPLGVIISNPSHLGGAIDSPAADKAARFMQLCDAFDLPILTLVDTPGFMVGPESEKTATVRHFARLFVTGANVTVPMFSVILRKAYGLGAQALLGGCLHAPTLTLAWPTAELGPMGFEGAVNLAYRKELAAIEDPAERQGFFEAKVAEMYEQGKALNVASYAEVDDVIDPADTRARIAAALRAAPPPEPRTGKKRPMVDSW